ncbi:MAG: hypothetical protein ACPGXL_02905 [Chitinophagales bacterium]
MPKSLIMSLFGVLVVSAFFQAEAQSDQVFLAQKHKTIIHKEVDPNYKPETVLDKNESLFMVNAQSINEERYEDIKGSPFYFETWQRGRVVENDSMSINDVLINFNAYEGTFEVKHGSRDVFIELDEKAYQRIEVAPNADEETAVDWNVEGKIIFQRKLHPRFKKDYVRVIYDGQKVKLVEHHKTIVDENTIQSYGETKVFKRFAYRKFFYLVEGEIATMVKLKRKKFLPMLRNPKALDKHLKSTGNDLNNYEDYVKLMTFYETELLGTK